MESYILEFVEYLEKQEVLCITRTLKVLEKVLTSKEDAKDGENQIESFANKHIELDYLKRIMQTPKEQWIKEKIIFADFYTLSNNLISSSLKGKDKVNIIFSMIERNISTGITDEKEDSKILGINREEFNENTVELYNKYKSKIDTDKIEISNLLEMLNKKKENIEELELYEYFRDTMTDMTEVGIYNKIIKEHYFDKLETFNEEDIEVILDTLQKMGVTKEMNNIVSNILMSKINKRNKTTNKKEYVVSKTKKEKNKSYNEIQEELLKYYNFSESMITSKTRMSLDEIINCVNLLTEVGAHKEQLYTFIKEATLANNRFEINPIVLYNEQYYKLEYYKERLGLETEFDNLKDLYQELFLLGEEDYEFGKKMLQTDLKNYLNYLPNNSDYEIEESKKLKKSTTK